MEEYVSTQPAPGYRDSAGIGYVIIPSDVDRRRFITQCYRKGTISLLLENGGVLDNVLITKEALKLIDFPEKANTKGSLLVWINQPKKQLPIVIGSLSKTNEFVNFGKNKGSLARYTTNFVSEVLVDADNGTIVITSNSSIEGGGDIYIVSTNKNKTSKLNIQVSGRVDVITPEFTLTNSKKVSLIIKDKSIDEDITEITYEKGVGLNYKDEFGNEIIANSDGINHSPSSKFTVGEGSESAMLGDTFKEILEQLTDSITQLASACAKITVNTSMGPSTVPTNATEITQISLDISNLKNKYSDFLSQINFTD